MVIAHLITGLSSGGAENQLQQLVLASNRCRFRHVVIALGEVGPIASELKASGIEVHVLGMKPGRPSIAGLVRLVRFLRRCKPVVLHCWLYHACLMGQIGATLAGVPSVIWGLRTAHGVLQDFRPMTRLVVRICARFSGLPDSIVVNSQSAKAVHRQFAYSTTRMSVIFNGVDTRRFAPDESARADVRTELGLSFDSVLIGMIARYDPMKDHETFLRAAAIVYRRFPKVRFLMAGAGIIGGNESLEQLLKTNGLERVVHLLGSRRDIARLTMALDIACLSSWSESSPNVVLEAMACAVPCVVTSVGDAPFMLSDSGKVVEPRDHAGFAEAITELIAMGSAERAVIGGKGRDRVLEKFDLHSTVSAYENIYDELKSKHG